MTVHDLAYMAMGVCGSLHLDASYAGHDTHSFTLRLEDGRTLILNTEEARRNALSPRMFANMVKHRLGEAK